MQSIQTKAPVEPDPAGPTPRPAAGELPPRRCRPEGAMSAGALSAGGTKKYTVVRGAFVSSLLRVIVVLDP